MKIFLKLIFGFVLISFVTTAFSQISENAARQIESLNREKEARTPVQKKIDSKLLYAAKQDRGEAITPLVRKLEVNVNKDFGGLVPVDIKVSSVTKTLLTAIRNAGGEITFQSSLFKIINAKIPLQAIEKIAASAEVLFIYPADKGSTNGPEKGSINKKFRIPFKNPAGSDRKLSKNFLSRGDEIKDQLKDYFENKEEFERDYFFIGSVTSEGDVTHRAAAARTAFGVDGTGIKIGVLSDGVANLAASQASGDLGPVTVLPGQAGINDEGTAMLEIIHDLAPGAQLYFATAVNGQGSFAQNILDLRAAGCDIIVDDVSYQREAVFQDDIIAQAVNTVTASGALYFASAGNNGNKDDNTSGVWEGDFNNAGTGTVGTVTITGGTVHNFGGTTNNQLIAGGISGRPIGLFWSDPLGGSGNDYDLYVLNNALTAIVATSNNVQDGNDDPIEFISAAPATNSRIVIFKKTAAAVRALHLNTFSGRLNINTQGQTHGHSAAVNAYSVAATPAATARGASPNPTGPFPNPHNGTNQTEIFSSDGPRRMFYNADSTPITPGNILFATNGGNVRQKPDITAADGVINTGPGDFPTRFYGTSAAAPHAAAIAALFKSGTSSFTPAQIRSVLTSTAIDIEGAGVDRNTGSGIVMAYESLQAVGASPQPVLQAGTATITAQSCTPGNGVIDPGETVTVSFCVQNIGAAATTNLVGTLQNTGGVTFAGGPQTYGAVPTGGTQVCRSFTFTANGTCGSTITASINLQDGTKNLGTVKYTFTLGVFTQSPVVSNTNNTAITIPAVGVASPYPSNITVSGLGNTTSKVTVRLNGLSHTYPGDVDILLVSPTGQKVILMADAGTAAVVNANLIFDDAAALPVPGTIPSNATNTYQPTDNDGTASLPAPAPARPYTGRLSTFNGFNPNGTWRLYVADSETGDMGSITSGWTLNITTGTVSCCVPSIPVITAPTVTQPTCTTPTGTIVVNAIGSGTLEFSIDSGRTYQLSNSFSSLAPGNYYISVRQQSNPANRSFYSGNPVVINAIPPAPATPTVTVTQPTSNSATGTITVNTPVGTGFTYSINNSVYQASNVFSNLTPGSYSIKAKSGDGCISQSITVTINPQPAVLVAGGTTITAQSCMPGNGVIDPGETVTVSFCIQNNGGTATTSNLTGTLQNTGGVGGASAAQNYGVVPTSGSPVCRSFSFTANGTCGGTITASINFQDGATNLGTVSYTFMLGALTSNTTTTTNNTAITIPVTANTTNPYPSNINVSGISGQVTKVTVRLNNLNHSYPSDLDILLVSPTGQKVILMAYAGGEQDVVNANLIFDDAVSSLIPFNGPIPSNATTTYKPTDYDGGNSLPEPAPERPYTTTLSFVNGLNPNGTWSLYVVDYADGDGGSITGGWTLNITTGTPSCCVTPPPVITAPTVTQPSCTTPTGTIVVNATGSGTLEYSINNGAAYQLSNTFSGLAAGSYNIRVRQQANPSNNTIYSANPVVINAAPAIPAMPTVTVTQPNSNSATGTITVNTPTGSGITYSINGSAYQVSTIFNNVAPGNYSVTAKNSVGCVSQATAVTIIPYQAVLVAGGTTITAQSCMPGNGVIDPGETVTVSFCVQNNGNAPSTTNLTGTLQNTGGVSGASAAQNYGVVPTSGSPVCRSFSFTANGACGGTVTATINFQDGATNLGTVTYTFTLGVFTPNPAIVTTNSTPIAVSNGVASPASPYPSNITISGITNPVTKVTVQLNNLNHTYPRDLDILLVSPTGQKVILTSFAGGDQDVVNANLIFDDAATSSLTNVGQIPSNTTTTYKPSDFGTASLPAPAPARPYTTTLSSVNGLNPNGTWSLYVADTEDNDGGSIANGWTLNITTSTASCCVTPPPVITAPTVTQPTCATPTGTIVVNATGSGTLEYSIDNGTTYQLSNTFSGLAAGNYNIRVRQQTNPANSTTYSANPVVINAAPAAPAMPTVTVTQPSCSAATGSITVNTPMGAGITYSINGTNYQSGNIFNNLMPGNYSVTAKNSSGCVSMAVPVTINAAPATAPAAPTVSVTQPTCAAPTGTISITAPVGSGITYSINGTDYQPGTTFSNVAPGNYNVTAKNSSGCVSAATPVTINATPSDNQPPVIPTNLTVFLNASSQASVTPASVAPLITDNCAVDPNSITVSANSFTCANITGATTYQPFVAINATGNQNAAGEQGMDFRVNATNGIVITQLGAFDHQANGLIGTQPDGNGGFGIRVAIFNKANQSIVSGLDVVITGNGDAFSGNYRYKNIPAVTLPPGDYVVLAKGYNANELSGNSYLGGGPYPQGDNASGAITYLNTAYYDENDAVPGFTYPSVSVNTGTSSVLKSGTFTYALSQNNVVTVTAKDVAGNQSQVNVNVMVVDTMYVLATKNITVNLNSSGQASIQPKDVLQSYKNKCGIDVISSTLQVSPSNFTCADVGAATLSSPHQPFIAINATGNQNAAGEQGMDFRVNATNGIVITQLGAFDHQANGLIGTQPDGNGGFGIRVAIFNKANQSIVSGLDVVITGNGDAFSGNYRYKNIPAVTLPPGDYVVLAKGYNANELSGNSYLGGGPYPQGDNASGAITYLNTAYYDENDAVPGFTYPTVSVNTGTSSVLKSGTFTYKTKMATGTLVTLTATDVYGNQKQATANVTVTDFNHVCTPAAKAAPVMAAAIRKQAIPVQERDGAMVFDNVTKAIKVYPNPSTGQFTVQLFGLKVSRVTLQIMDANGMIVEQKIVRATGKMPSLTIPIDIRKHASGIYIIKVISADGVQAAKVVVGH